VKEYFVYMLRCEGERLYTGYTADVKKRLASHSTGRGGAKFTRGFRPLGMAALWKVAGGRGGAMKVEALIKSLGRDEKKELAAEPFRLEAMIVEKGIPAEVMVCDPGEYSAGGVKSRPK
jgi:putative endonuclease